MVIVNCYPFFIGMQALVFMNIHFEKIIVLKLDRKLFLCIRTRYVSYKMEAVRQGSKTHATALC